MGFKPKKSLKRHYHVKPSQFLIPDEAVSTEKNSIFCQFSSVLAPCLALLPVAPSVPFCLYLLFHLKFDYSLGQGV